MKFCLLEDNEVVSFAAKELKKYEEFLPEVEDKYSDDAIYINIENGKGVITGTNPRSVLIGVYRYLNELGCAFIRPGIDNEVIPLCNPKVVGISYVLSRICKTLY